jgi:hypothetical protein
MGRSRYFDTPVTGSRYETWTLPTAGGKFFRRDFLEGVQTFEHIVMDGDRLDALAARYLGDDTYWWVLAIVNDVKFGLSLTPGRHLRIPRDIRPVLDRLGS